MTINRVFKNRHSTPSINKSMNKTATIPFIFIHFFAVAVSCFIFLLPNFFPACPFSFFFSPLSFIPIPPHSASLYLSSISVHWYSITYRADAFSLVSTKWKLNIQKAKFKRKLNKTTIRLLWASTTNEWIKHTLTHSQTATSSMQRNVTVFHSIASYNCYP